MEREKLNYEKFKQAVKALPMPAIKMDKRIRRKPWSYQKNAPNTFATNGVGLAITRKVIYQKHLPVSQKKAFMNVSAAQQKKENRNDTTYIKRANAAETNGRGWASNADWKVREREE